ncbi:roadblock/LC7 domain-containing protein [Methanobacterium sp.]|uniref:roadblock/LC7 domain-containing protein n=1 Tax=Methanobacterium sp. TaxID=2164 RepID=UPI003C76F6FE
MDSDIENQLIRTLSNLDKVEGIDGSLIADDNGNVICHTMSKGTDTFLFGPMAHVIMSSSKRLLNSAKGGEIQRVLVESYGGKALFLHLENTYFIVLMEISANVGLVMVSAKRAAKEIMKITRDIVWAAPVEEEVIVDSHEEIPVTSEETKVSEVQSSLKTETVKIEKEASSEELETAEVIGAEELNEEAVGKLIETEGLKEAFANVIGTEKLNEILESEEFKSLDIEEAKEKLSKLLEIETKEAANVSIELEDLELSKESEIIADKIDTSPEIEVESTVEKAEIPDKVKEEIPEENLEYVPEEKTQEEIGEEIEEPGSKLPVIKPPISFPELPENVEIPSGDKEKSDLILDIYESVFLAMSIGASKIMGVSPARGLIKRFLPLDECKTLLNGVDVKSNSVVDFNKIRENSESIPLTEREDTLITDFSKIISIITENYGKVMGYGAFRGIVRREFKTINNSYGKAMADLGIKDKIHPELISLFK